MNVILTPIKILWESVQKLIFHNVQQVINYFIY